MKGEGFFLTTLLLTSLSSLRFLAHESCFNSHVPRSPLSLFPSFQRLENRVLYEPTQSTAELLTTYGIEAGTSLALPILTHMC